MAVYESGWIQNKIEKRDWNIMKAEKGLNILARMLLILFVISATILPVLTTDSNQPELDGY